MPDSISPPMDTIFCRPSVTLDEAVFNLLGEVKGPVEFFPPDLDYSNEAANDLASLSFDLREHFEEERDSLESAYLEAKHDGFPDKEIAERYEVLQTCEAKIARANTFLCDINAELAKGDLSALQLDPEFEGYADKYVTLSSLAQWATDKYGISILSPISSSKTKPEPQAPQPASESLWLIARPDDPSPEQPWYVPARYFAREFVKEEPTLVLNKKLLAIKVAKALGNVRIHKRGGIKPLDPATILKAFSNINFG